MAKLSDGWNVETFVYDNGVLNVVVTNTDGTDIEVLSKEPGDDGEDGSKIIRFTTKEIKEEEKTEKSYKGYMDDDDASGDIEDYLDEKIPGLDVEVKSTGYGSYRITIYGLKTDGEVQSGIDEVEHMQETKMLFILSEQDVDGGVMFEVDLTDSAWI